MGDICCICLEEVVIPVEPTCFRCVPENGQISCFSMKRICMNCLENYLELNKHRLERPIKKKCIFCPAVINLQQTPRNETFRVDYLMMDRDYNKRYSCIYPQCSFEGSHIQLARHLFSDCPYFTVECVCGDVCHRNELLDHQGRCDKYEICNICESPVLKTDLPRHMYYSHDKTKCFTCHKYIGMDNLSEHIISDCPERLVACEMCNSFIRFKNFKPHLHNHLSEINKNIQIIRNKLKEEEYNYVRIQKLLDVRGDSVHRER